MSTRGGLHRFQLGPYVIDYQLRTITQGSTRIDVHWRSFEALRALIDAAGEVVGRERLQELLWPGVTVEESNLQKYISQLRKALNAGDPNHDYVETVPRIGYRLLVPASELLDGGGIVEAESIIKPRLAYGLGRRFRMIGLVFALCLGAALAFWWWMRERMQGAELERAYRASLNLLRRRDLVSMKTAADEFRLLVQSHPQFAPGWAGLAEASALIHPEDATVCLELAERSVRINPGCGECHAILGFILFTRHWNWHAAGEHLARAFALSPDDPQARYWLAQMEAAKGHIPEALRVLEETQKRNPQSLNTLVMKAGCLYFARDYQAALQASEQALALNLPAAWYWRANALFQIGRHVEAIRSMAYDLGAGSTRSIEATANRADALVAKYREAGLAGALGVLLNETGSKDIAEIQSYNRATWFMLLGEYDAALRELEIATDARPRPFNLIYLGVDPLFDPIRRKPGFQRLLQKLGFSQIGASPK